MEKVSKEKFEQYLCERGDKLDNAAHEFLSILARKEIDWDISIIREVIDYAASILQSNNIRACDPYYTTVAGDNGEEIPIECCNLGDCCRNCPLRNDP